MGTSAENTFIMPEMPSSATTPSSSTNTAEAISEGTAKSCSTVAPTPAVMMTTTPSKNALRISPASVRRNGTFHGTMISSTFSSPDSCSSRIMMMPKAASSTQARSSPTYPFTPNSPKNCHNSWPDTNPAPKKHPAKARASGMILISFIFSLLCRGFFIITKGGTFVKVAKMVAQKFTKPFGKLC